MLVALLGHRLDAGQLSAATRSPSFGSLLGVMSAGAGVLALADVVDRATITVEEAVEILGIGRRAAYEGVRRGQLPGRRIGRRLVVPVPALMAWLGADDAAVHLHEASDLEPR